MVSTASETIFLDNSLSNLPASPPVYPSFHRRIAGALSTRAPQTWIEHIAQRVADEVERQDDQRDRDARSQRHPWLVAHRAPQIGAQHRAQARVRRGDPESQER